ncbi:caspase family protein [Flavihumibacter fluvii]|uniref:caspase family protein n=1 Tax=Flavihumibacter fluvii TaxID=2838157 RepID=UPI001BDF475C|nr:caspase family protein [Flavihumibacter fluvii]ULQ51780.1 caspase family protein [Flavihumibacter fluvii]
MANLFALLVGINNYPVKPLQGCINDVDAIEEYLRMMYGENKSVSLHIKRVTDAETDQPTKANFIKAFDHFNAAGKGDTCLFYYSGHGSFSPAPAEFWTDTNGSVQSFVCIDSRLEGGRDLMDKEVSFLIWKLMRDKPETDFVAITDCCHSGTITKALDDSGIVDRMVPGRSFPDKVEEYFGYDVQLGNERAYVSSTDPATGQTRVTVRQAGHIHLAASRDNQTAKELSIDGKRRGAFTHSLLKILYNCNGKISYKDLVDRAAILVKNLVSDQQSDININGGLPGTIKQKNFLFGESVAINPAKFLVYNDPKFGWCIKAGSLQGVAKGDLVIIDGLLETTVSDMPAPDFSTLQSKLEFGKNDQVYFAEVKCQPNHPLSFSFAPGFPEAAAILIRSALTDAPSPFLEYKASETGRYIVRINADGDVYLSLPGNDQPVFQPQPVNSRDMAAGFLSQMESVSRWIHLLEFTNPLSGIKKEHYALRLFKEDANGGWIPVDEIKPRNDFYYRQQQEEWIRPQFRLSVTNNSSGPIWVTTAYMGFDYSIATNYFPPMELAPGKEGFLLLAEGSLMSDTIPLILDEKFARLGYNEITEYLKLFISPTKIETDKLQQAGISLAAKFVKHPEKGLVDDKGIGTISGAEPLSKLDWITETIGLTIIRPASTKSIEPGKTTALYGLNVIAPKGFSAKATVTSSAITSRSADGIPAPHLVNNNSELEPVDLVSGTRSGYHMDVLELFDVQQQEAISRENPILVQAPPATGGTDENILPLAYDTVNGIYYPVGFTNEGGLVSIENLPAETASDAAITNRSLGGSIKIYFQKVIGKKLGLAYNYPRLAIATINEAGDVMYDADKDRLAQAVRSANKVLLFIHGIIGDTEGMVKCIKTVLDEQGNTLEKKADLVLSFDYENLHTPIDQTARDLKASLVSAGFTDGASKELIIMAHSMGGLVSRYFIEKEEGNKMVTRLYMFGTPNNGTPWADVRDLAETLITYAINGAAFLKPWLFVLSAVGKIAKGTQVTLKQMDSKTGIFDVLNNGFDPGIPYHIIAGNTQLIHPLYAANHSAIAKLFQRIRKRGIYDALDLALFKKPNDIAVATDSIETLHQSAGWKKQPVRKTVASDHLSYFLSPEALNEVI